MIAYDIADSKRLKRVHRILKECGIAAQKSVFFVKGNETQINNILDKLSSKIIFTEDDIRAYPIIKPENIWTNGTNPLSEYPIINSKQQNKAILKKNKRLSILWERIQYIFQRN